VLNILKTPGLMAILQAALSNRASYERMAYRFIPPQPRTRSHAGKSYPHHSTNAKNHFARKSGCGYREMERRARQQGTDWLY
jgi:hypothetical protein